MKHFSRRDFLHAGCVAGAATLALGPLEKAHAILKGSIPNAGGFNGGKSQINFGNFSGGDYPSIDIVKQSPGWVAYGGTYSNGPINPAYYDVNGLPTQVTGGGGYFEQVICPPTSVRPGPYVERWSGGDAGTSILVPSGSMLTYAITGITPGATTTITISGPLPHYLLAGFNLYPTGLSGAYAALNFNNYAILSVTSNTITLNVNTTGFGAFSGTGTLNQNNTGANGRFVYQPSPSWQPQNHFVGVAAISTAPPANYVTALHVMYAASEAAWLGGQIWDPQFLYRVRQSGSGSLRFLNWLNDGGELNTTTWLSRKGGASSNPLNFSTWASVEWRASLCPSAAMTVVGGILNAAATMVWSSTNGGTVTITTAAAHGLTVGVTLGVSVSDIPTITSGTYSSSTGVVTLTTTVATGAVVGSIINVNNLTGTGNYGSLQGVNFTVLSASGTTITYNAGTGFGAATITGGIYTLGTYGIEFAIGQIYNYNYQATVTGTNTLTFPYLAASSPGNSSASATYSVNIYDFAQTFNDPIYGNGAPVDKQTIQTQMAANSTYTAIGQTPEGIGLNAGGVGIPGTSNATQGVVVLTASITSNVMTVTAMATASNATSGVLQQGMTVSTNQGRITLGSQITGTTGGLGTYNVSSVANIASQTLTAYGSLVTYTGTTFINWPNHPFVGNEPVGISGNGPNQVISGQTGYVRASTLVTGANGRFELSATPGGAALVTGAFSATISISGTTATISGLTGTPFTYFGQFIFGPTIIDGTEITGQLSGPAGGNGTYSVNIAQTASSQTCTFYDGHNNAIASRLCTLNLNSTGAFAFKDSTGGPTGNLNDPITSPGGSGPYAVNPFNHTMPIYGTFVFDNDLQSWLMFGANCAQGNVGLTQGVPYEAMLDLCKQVGAHPDIPAPMLALDPMTDHTRSLATLIKNYPGGFWFIPRFEGPNEDWNFIFWQTNYGSNKANLHWGTSASFVDWYGKIASTMGQDINAVYGGGSTAIGGFGGQFYNMCIGVQTGYLVSSASFFQGRFTSMFYTGQSQPAQSGYSKTPAYNWYTHGRMANYYSPAIIGTSTEAGYASTYNTNAAKFNGYIDNNGGGAVGNVLTVTQVLNGNIIIGTTIRDDYSVIGANTTITSQISGTTGGVGTYAVSGVAQLFCNSTIPTYLQPFMYTEASAATTAALAYLDTVAIAYNPAGGYPGFGMPTVVTCLNNFKALLVPYPNNAGNAAKINFYEGGYSPDYSGGSADFLRYASKRYVDTAISLTGGTLNNSTVVNGNFNDMETTSSGVISEFPSIFQTQGGAWGAMDPDTFGTPTTPYWNAIGAFN